MERDCALEVVELHQFLQDWMTGASPRTADAYARLAEVLADGFTLINPRGVANERGALMAELEGAHGVHADEGFRIWIDNPLSRHQLGDFALVTYEEWQQLAGKTSARLSTALFRRRRRLPNRVEWLHLHETWLPGHAAKG